MEINGGICSDSSDNWVLGRARCDEKSCKDYAKQILGTIQFVYYNSVNSKDTSNT